MFAIGCSLTSSAPSLLYGSLKSAVNIPSGWMICTLHKPLQTCHKPDKVYRHYSRNCRLAQDDGCKLQYICKISNHIDECTLRAKGACLCAQCNPTFRGDTPRNRERSDTARLGDSNCTSACHACVE